MNLTNLRAKIALAILFFRHLVRRAFLFWRKKDGLRQFLALYGGDAIYPVSEKERAAMPGFQKCQVCSLCTFTCKAVLDGKAPGNFEPKFLMIGYGRSSHEAEFFLEEWLPCYECRSCTVVCPNDVPLHDMAETIVERRKHVAFRA